MLSSIQSVRVVCLKACPKEFINFDGNPPWKLKRFVTSHETHAHDTTVSAFIRRD